MLYREPGQSNEVLAHCVKTMLGFEPIMNVNWLFVLENGCRKGDGEGGGGQVYSTWDHHQNKVTLC